MEITNLIIQIFVLVVAIVTIYFSFWQHRENKKLALKQLEWDGAIAQNDIGVQLFNKEGIESYYFDVPIPKKGFLMIPLVLTLSNVGQRTLENIEFSMYLPKDLCFGGNVKILQTEETLKKIKFARQEEEYILKNKHSIDTLHPNQGMRFIIHASFLRETKFRFNIPATSSDGVNFVASGEVEYAYQITVEVACKDRSPLKKTFSIQIHDNSAGSLSDKINENNEKILEKTRKRRADLEEYIHNITYASKQKICIFASTDQLVKYDNKELQKVAPVYTVKNMGNVEAFEIIEPKSIYDGLIYLGLDDQKIEHKK